MVSEFEEKQVETDVLVVGGGIAGCFAAIKARERGANVILVDKGFVGKSGQTLYASSFLVFNPDWGHKLDDWMNYLNSTSEYVNNRFWTEISITESYARYQDLISWGVEFIEGEDGKPYSVTMPHGVTQHIFIKGGDITPFLRKQVLKSGVKIYDRIMISELLKQNGRIVGAIGIPAENYDLYVFKAKSTIMCVGACSFKPAGYPSLVSLTADGEAMAYRAGAEITGKEFVDVHAFSAESLINAQKMPKMDISTSSPPAPIMTNKKVNAHGQELPARPAGTSSYPFSYLQSEFEVHAGRAPVYSFGPGGTKQEIVGGSALGMCLRKAEGIWPANNKCASSIPGLYAAGDALGNMQNGAVYTAAGSALTGGAVTGTIAGEAAADEALQMGTLAVDEKEISRAKHVVMAPTKRQGGFSPRWVTRLLQSTIMPYYVSFIKKEDRLQAALTLVGFMQKHLVPQLYARDPHELRLAHETKNMVLNAEMWLRSPLFRTESRGNHYREDYPQRDDLNWLAWVKIKEENGEMKLSKEPIPKEWWPDLSMPYQQRYPSPFPEV